MKIKNITLLLIALAITVLFVAGCSSPPEDVTKATIGGEKEMSDLSQATAMTIDTTTSTFSFEGYAPGKSHIGTFDDFTGMLYTQDGKVVGAKGSIKAMSVNTGIEGLDKHLKNDDFFDIEMYEDITFESTSIDDGMMYGTLSFHGVTQTISFPVTTSATSLSADFLLDTTAYNMKYVGVNKEVRIFFDMMIS